MKSPQIVSVWNPKGGQGKSLLSINLAAAAVSRGHTPLVICQDHQGTSTKYGQHGQCPFDVLQSMPSTRPDADLILVDEQAGDWELPRWQLLVMPVKPKRDQFVTFQEARDIAIKAGKIVLPVVTDTHHSRRAESKLAIKLAAMGAKVLPSSTAFGRASLEWTTIFDPRLDNVHGVRDRRNNLLVILDAILEGNNQ